MALVAASVALDLLLVVPLGAGPAVPWEQRNLAQGVHRASFQELVAADNQNQPRIDNIRKQAFSKFKSPQCNANAVTYLKPNTGRE